MSTAKALRIPMESYKTAVGKLYVEWYYINIDRMWVKYQMYLRRLVKYSQDHLWPREYFPNWWEIYLIFIERFATLLPYSRFVAGLIKPCRQTFLREASVMGATWTRTSNLSQSPPREIYIHVSFVFSLYFHVQSQHVTLKCKVLKRLRKNNASRFVLPL